MGKVYKNIKIAWSWSGKDDYVLKGFNVALAPDGANPNNTGDLVSFHTVSKEPPFEHIFRGVLLESNSTYVAWVQSLYPNKDSNWVSEGNITVSDDGSSTIATTNADNNPINAGAGGVTIDSNGITITNGRFSIKSQNDNFRMDNDGLRAYDDNGNQTVNIQASDGSAWFKGTVEAEAGLILPIRSSP